MALKLNILQLIGNFHQGGSERQAVQLARLLHEGSAHQVHVACLDGGGVLRGEVERWHAGAIAEFPLTSFYDRTAVKQLGRFVRFVRERRIDIVHTHDFYSNVFGMTGARLAGVRARIAARRETGGVRTRNQLRVEHAAYRFAHKIVANAEAVRQQLIEEGVSAAKVTVVHNGLDLAWLDASKDLSRAEQLARCGLPSGERRPLVTIVANMRFAVKDQATFLRAAGRVKEVVPEAAFVLAGEGELMSGLREFAAQLGLAGSAYFIGRCAHVAELLRVSDVCVLSSRAEGFSNAILEYMAAARPVVATDVGGAREAISDGETGYLVAAGDDEAMARCVVELLRAPDRARAMGARARQVVEQKFSLTAQFTRTEELYRRLLDAPPRHSSSPRRMESVEREGA